MTRPLPFVALCCAMASGQAPPPPAMLTIDIENFVEYQSDVTDPSKIATNPNITPVLPPRNFFLAATLGDIVAVNGQPAKGTYAAQTWVVGLSSNPKPGQAIADTTRTALRYATFEILKSDGTLVGTIMVMGSAGGSPPPPGAPLAQTAGNFAIMGGTGAYLGVRGQYGQVTTSQTVPVRLASTAEDPSNRRTNGGGKVRYLVHLMQSSVPQIAATANGPAVVHSSDFSPVTSSKPATAGELLSLFATGLGPTQPGVAPGQPFPSIPVAVNSPVDVTVNGKPAEVVAAVGFPGAVDGYQVNFRVPADTAKGLAAIQVSAAWIAGAPVTVTVE